MYYFCSNILAFGKGYSAMDATEEWIMKMQKEADLQEAKIRQTFNEVQQHLSSDI